MCKVPMLKSVWDVNAPSVYNTRGVIESEWLSSTSLMYVIQMIVYS